MARRKSKMERYCIETYDFLNDEEFQAFFAKKLGGKTYPKPQFMRKLESAKKEWIKQLNNVNRLRKKPD